MTSIGTLRIMAEQGPVFSMGIMAENNESAGVVFSIGMGPTSQCSCLGAA